MEKYRGILPVQAVALEAWAIAYRQSVQDLVKQATYDDHERGRVRYWEGQVHAMNELLSRITEIRQHNDGLRAENV